MCFYFLIIKKKTVLYEQKKKYFVKYRYEKGILRKESLGHIQWFTKCHTKKNII